MQDRSGGTSEATGRPPTGKREREPASVSRWGNILPSPAERAELRRNSLLREAARSFNRTGFHGTSMDDIARRLGVTKAALYRYIPNKHELLLASFNLAMDSSIASLDRAEKEGVNGLDKVRIALRGYLEDLIGRLGHPVVLLEEGALRPNQARAVIRRRDEAEKRYRNLIRKGIKDGSIIPCDPKLAAFALLGATNWVPKWYRDDGEWSAEEVAESLVNLVTRSIAVHPKKGRVDNGSGDKKPAVSSRQLKATRR